MMKLKLKVAVAAVALAASMSANAAMTNNASGDSSLILTLLDNTNNISLTVDLGYSNTSFNRNANTTWNIAGGDYSDAWNTYWATATAGNTQWAVASGNGNLGNNEVFTTMYSASATLPSYSNLTTATASFDTYINANNLIGNHQAVSNGASTAGGGAAFAEASAAYGTTGFYGLYLGDTTGALDSNLSVNTFTAPSNSGLTKAVRTQYANAGFNTYFNMNQDGTLNYVAVAAPVPEADVSAMLLAGLGMMGFIARRRTRTTA